MKLKPILFSTPMVQAILEGRKTMTRRIIKSRHESGLFQVSRMVKDGQIMSIESLDWDERNCEKDITPKYRVGDTLWVREAYFAYGWWVKEGRTKSGKQKLRFIVIDADGKYHYPGNPPAEIINGRPEKKMGWYKRSSLFMPFEAARIFLEVTNVRAERLQDISEEDAIAEGIEMVEKYPEESPGVMYYRDYLCKNRFAMGISFKAKQSFQTLWQSINGPGSWEANPWVFVYEFKRTEKPIN